MDNGYRNYADDQVRRLFLALVYRDCGMPLKDIAKALDSTALDDLLDAQHGLLIDKKKKIEAQITLLEQLRSDSMVKSEDIFNSYVQEKLDENDGLYGAEVTRRFGKDSYRASQKKISALSDAEFIDLIDEGTSIMRLVGNLMKAGHSPEDKQVQELIAKHFAHIKKFGDFYTLEIYEGLGQMYSKDPRFAKTFNDIAEGLAGYFTQATEYFCVEQA